MTKKYFTDFILFVSESDEGIKMKIAPISSLYNASKISNLNVKKLSFGAENLDSVREETGVNGDILKITDTNSRISVDNASNEKVGSKFIITFNDPKYRDLKILYKPDSTFKSANESLGLSLYNPKSLNPSFSGKIYGSIRQDDDGTKDTKMMQAYIGFWSSGMHRNILNNYVDYSLTSKIKDDYNFYIPSDGDGSRYKDITALQGGITKPASYIPAQLNSKNMSLVQCVLTNYAKTNKLEPSPQYVFVKPAQGSAFAFLEGLKSGKIPADKPLVFSWGDNFSDINISKLILEHEQKNSGLTILTIPVDTERVKALSAVKIDNFDNKVVQAFKEKPTDENEIKNYQLDELDGKILSSVGPFVLSKEVLQWIKDNYTVNPQSFLSPEGKGYDFSSMILTPLVEVFNRGEIADTNGIPLSMRVKPIDTTETWSDLGNEKDFTAEMNRIKSGGYQGLPLEMRESISKNIDENGNVTFNDKSKELLQSAIKEYGLELKNVIAYAA